MEWIKCSDRLPEVDDNTGFSDNVLTWCDDQLYVMQYGLIKDDDDEWCFAWLNCYGDVNGDAYFDDNYNPEFWMPLPTKPTI